MVIMRLWVRLLSLCVSLTLLGGLMLHDVAGAQMSFDMAAASISDQNENVCPACEAEDAETIACNVDCTAQMPFIGASSAPSMERLVVDAHPSTGPDSMRMRRPGFDPAPPRTNFLS